MLPQVSGAYRLLTCSILHFPSHTRSSLPPIKLHRGWLLGNTYQRLAQDPPAWRLTVSSPINRSNSPQKTWSCVILLRSFPLPHYYPITLHSLPCWMRSLSLSAGTRNECFADYGANPYSMYVIVTPHCRSHDDHIRQKPASGHRLLSPPLASALNSRRRWISR